MAHKRPLSYLRGLLPALVDGEAECRVPVRALRLQRGAAFNQQADDVRSIRHRGRDQRRRARVGALHVNLSAGVE